MSGQVRFADAVRAVAKMAPAVRAGLVSAAILCATVPFAPSYANSVERAGRTGLSDLAGKLKYLEAVRGSDLTEYEFLGKGLKVIAEADLSSLPARDAVRTIKAMAESVIRNSTMHYEADLASDVTAVDDETFRKAAKLTDAVTAANRLAATELIQLASDDYPDAATAQARAAATLASAQSRLDAAGLSVDLISSPTSLDVPAEMRKALDTKLEVLRKVADTGAAADYDGIQDLFIDVESATAERAPAPRVLLAALAERVSSDPTAAGHDEVARTMAQVVVADGTLRNLSAAWSEQREFVDGAKLARIAKSSLDIVENLDAIGPKSGMRR